METVMWRNTELKIGHFSLEVVKSHSLNKVNFVIIKENAIFQHLKYNRAVCSQTLPMIIQRNSKQIPN